MIMKHFGRKRELKGTPLDPPLLVNISNYLLEPKCNVNLAFLFKRVYQVSKGAKIRNRYNQVPHLTKNFLTNLLKLEIYISIHQ